MKSILGAIALILLCGGCASRQTHSAAAASIERAQTGVTRAAESNERAGTLAADASTRIHSARTHLERAEAKEAVITQWEARQRRRHAKP